MLGKTNKEKRFSEYHEMMLYNTKSTLLELVYFLKDNDERFKDFDSLYLRGMENYRTEEEDLTIIETLNSLIKEKVCDIPNIEGFTKILIDKGLEVNNSVVKILVNATALQYGKNSIIGSVCNIILAKS